MGPQRKPIVWLKGDVKTPPFSQSARLETGYLLGKLQEGELIGMPHSRPMPSIGGRCHELRIVDKSKTWRLFYRIDPHAIIVCDVLQKTTQATPHKVIEECRQRLKRYDAVGKKGHSK